jgi:hypothetical protein
MKSHSDHSGNSRSGVAHVDAQFDAARIFSARGKNPHSESRRSTSIASQVTTVFDRFREIID